MTADERAALRALAEKATPGPREARGDSVCIERSFVCHAARMYLIDRERDAAYIAAANPAAITALLAALDAVEAERDAAIARAEAAEGLLRENSALRDRECAAEELDEAQARELIDTWASLYLRIDAHLAAKGEQA